MAFTRKIIQNNDQQVSVYLNLNKDSQADCDQRLIHCTTDTGGTFDENVPNTYDIELTLAHVTYSLSCAENATSAGSLNIGYGLTTDSADAFVLVSLPPNSGELSFYRAIGHNVTGTTTNFTGHIDWGTGGVQMSGYAILTFNKKTGYLRNFPGYRKATQANPNA